MRGLLVTILILFCISCTTTKYIEKEVPIETIRTEYITNIKHDSIHIKDSIDRFIKGDTVYIYKYKDIFKYRYLTDTVILNDTIQVPVNITETTVEKVYKTHWYEDILIFIGVISLVIFIIRLLIKKK